jgi:hypothetical protein
MKNRKELLVQYKESKPTMGVFQIRNNSNGRLWIEGSINPQARWNRHKSELNFGSHRNTELQADWNQYGEQAFEFSILQILKPNDNRDAKVNYSKEVEQLAALVLEELSPQPEVLYNN